MVKDEGYERDMEVRRRRRQLRTGEHHGGVPVADRGDIAGVAATNGVLGLHELHGRVLWRERADIVQLARGKCQCGHLFW